MEQSKELYYQVMAFSHGRDVPPSLRAKAIDHILKRWPTSDLDEARVLVEIMEAVPATAWLEYVDGAERQAAIHSELLLAHADRLYESIAFAVAEEDGLTC